MARPEPVLAWHFDAGEETTLWAGEAGESVAGPRPPHYPRFAATNRALLLKAGTSLPLPVASEHQGGRDRRLDFSSGDAITLEAWIAPRLEGLDGPVCLLGRGDADLSGGGNALDFGLLLRPGRAGQGQGAVKIGFVFAGQTADAGAAGQQQWWSDDAYLSGSEWHHVLVTFTFGAPDSLRAYYDGMTVTGTWENKETAAAAPRNRGNTVRIGGPAGAPGRGYRGAIDAVAVHRALTSPDAARSRFAFSPPPPPDMRDQVRKGHVLVQVCDEGLSPSRRWPESPPPVGTTYEEDAFGLFALPHHYIATGVRGDRGHTVLVRASASVSFPRGRHRLLLRARGVSRLYVDGKRVLTTPLPPIDTAGHGITEHQNEYLNLGPDFRFAPPGNRESWCHFESSGSEHLVVLETILGGKQANSWFRQELGETVVAWSREGEESWSLLAPGDCRVPYTDDGWAAYEAERRQRLDAVDARHRRAQREAFADYWTRRRQAARTWLDSTPAVTVPALPPGYPANNAIDHFLAERIAGVRRSHPAAASGGVDYFRQVQPLLEKKCYDCHQGSNVKGGLRLDRAAFALKGGKVDGPALVRGEPEQSAMIFRVSSEDEEEVMPPKGDRLRPDEVQLLAKWIREGASWPEFRVDSFEFTPLTDDLAFLRRIMLDTVGVVPTEAEIRAFQRDTAPGRRERLADRLLADPRWADHWVSYWQDVLAENPNIINPTLNNTGPFRWWTYESLLDDKPMDLFVTELIRMEGSERYGGPAGFGVASQNDVPLAEKGAILSAAFLGVEMKCARCHDAPAHRSTQKDLFQLAAMLNQAPVGVPATSSVPKDKLHEGGRKPLIQVTLEPGTEVTPGWPFAAFCDEATAVRLAMEPDNTRDRLAALITAPANERFAQVMVNRVWHRLMGRGLVPTIADWERSEPTHPELLRWLAREFVRSDYSLKAVARLILNSHAYQRASNPRIVDTEPLFISPAPRRLAAEQIVDSLFVATGKPFKVEEISLDIDSVRPVGEAITLGHARRAWMLASTSNERDRPSLSLPRIQAVATVMEAFGWRGARQDPVSVRESTPNVLQPAILSNGVMGTWLIRLSDDHGLTALACEDQPLDHLIERLYLRLLTRLPTADERRSAAELLGSGYTERKRAAPPAKAPENRVRAKFVSWSNHLDGPANVLAQEAEVRARRGDPPTSRLDTDWRERMEDLVWALINTPEWIFSR